MKKAIIWLLSIILISFSYSLNNARMTIQMNPGNEFDSFEFTNDPIIEIGQQTGWTGEFSFNGESGDI